MVDVFSGRNSYLNVNSSTFGRVDARMLVRTFDLTARRFRSRLLRLVDDLAANRIDVQGFTSSARRLIRTEYGISFALGALSITPFYTVTTRDIRLIDAEIEGERHFLREFARDIVNGRLILTPVQRAGLYLQALRGMFELGRINALPAGPYIWVLGPTEHCIPCIESSFGGPYQKEKYSGLGLPELPGIPGSGDICKGLTRCGCRIKLEHVAIPNEDIQLEVRDVLMDVIHDAS